MTIELEFFSAPQGMTTPGKYANLLDDLPSDADSLCRIVQGLMVHIFWADKYGLQLSEERRSEVQLRSAARKLERIIELDGRPLAQPRDPETRLVGNCRDFSVLLTAMLRSKGVPARARCGFARYFVPNHFEDHWVCEYWNTAQHRWVLMDAQLDTVIVNRLNPSFDPHDVPRDEFIVAGKAWEMCRTGQADPNCFGIFEMSGLWFIRGNLGRDVAALNQMELLPWDAWGILDTRDEELNAKDIAALDQIAALTSADVPQFEQVQKMYESDTRFRVPETIRSYSAEGAKTIDLALNKTA